MNYGPNPHLCFYQHSEYLSNVFDPDRLEDAVNRVHMKLMELRASGLEFEAIAFTGNSGAGIAFPLSAQYGYSIICVRKEPEYHGSKVEATVGNFKKYIIVDDIIASGRTIRRIVDNLPHSECVGVVLYRSLTAHAPNNIPVFSILEHN